MIFLRVLIFKGDFKGEVEAFIPVVLCTGGSSTLCLLVHKFPEKHLMFAIS